MEVFQKRPVAIALCIIMILLASILGAGGSLRTLREQTEAAFSLGLDGSGKGIKYDLGEIAAQAYNMTVVAGRYLPETDANITGVLSKREELQLAQSPKELHRLCGELVAATTVLQSTLEVLELSAQDWALVQKCAVSIQSSLDLISRSGYNEAATSYNRALRSFPGGTLGRLTGVAPLELYE